MDAIFMNSENNKTSDPRRLLLYFLHKININMVDECVAYQILASTMHGKT